MDVQDFEKKHKMAVLDALNAESPYGGSSRSKYQRALSESVIKRSCGDMCSRAIRGKTVDRWCVGSCQRNIIRGFSCANRLSG